MDPVQGLCLGALFNIAATNVSFLSIYQLVSMHHCGYCVFFLIILNSSMAFNRD